MVVESGQGGRLRDMSGNEYIDYLMGSGPLLLSPLSYRLARKLVRVNHIGLVNLINESDPDAFRHVIIALTESSDLEARIRRPDVAVHALGKKPGQDPTMQLRLFRLLRRLEPAIVHTRNIGTLECQVTAMLAVVSDELVAQRSI